MVAMVASASRGPSNGCASWHRNPLGNRCAFVATSARIDELRLPPHCIPAHPTKSFGVVRPARRALRTNQPDKEGNMAMQRWRPWRGLARADSPMANFRRLDQQMQDMFERFASEYPTAFGPEGRTWAPALDVVDRKDEVLVRADLPGLEQKDVHVELQDHTLLLRGERTENREEKEGDYYCCERWEGRFDRTIPLPAEVDTNKINATFKNGVLEVHLPKTKEARGKKIEIRTL
jgi:HSP20 family protein